MAVHRGADLILSRILRRAEEVRSLNHHPVLAIAAMRHLNVDPSLLQRMKCRRRSRRPTLLRPKSRKPFERSDALTAHCRHRSDARADLLTVQKHRASTT